MRNKLNNFLKIHYLIIDFYLLYNNYLNFTVCIYSRVYYHKFTQEGPPRQSKAFKVLQVITGTQDSDEDIEKMNSRQIRNKENRYGYTDL